MSTAHTTNAKSDTAAQDIKSAIKGIHGIGETIRGKFNAGVDHTFNESAGEAKNEAIASKGEQNIRHAADVLEKHETKHGLHQDKPTTGNAATATVRTGGLAENSAGVPTTPHGHAQEAVGGGAGAGPGAAAAAGTHAEPVGSMGGAPTQHQPRLRRESAEEASAHVNTSAVGATPAGLGDGLNTSVPQEDVSTNQRY